MRLPLPSTEHDSHGQNLHSSRRDSKSSCSTQEDNMGEGQSAHKGILLRPQYHNAEEEVLQCHVCLIPFWLMHSPTLRAMVRPSMFCPIPNPVSSHCLYLAVAQALSQLDAPLLETEGALCV